MVASPGWLADADRRSSWSELRVCVAGLGVSGFAAADALLQLGADVVAVDARPEDELGGAVQVLDTLGAQVRLGAEAATALPEGTQLVVTSPGWRPNAPLLVAAADAAIPVWGEVELAWRLRPDADPAPWLVVTGTNGKTTTVRMLAAMLQADGRNAVAAGNVGTPLVQAVLGDPRASRTRSSPSSCPASSCTGRPRRARWPRRSSTSRRTTSTGTARWRRTPQDKGRAYENTEVACVYNVADPQTERLVRAAEVQEGCRAIGFTLGVPSVGMVGVVEDLLVDRAFVEERHSSAVELGSVSDVSPYAPHNVANALAAAALARAYGVRPVAVRDGLRGFRPDPHRIAHVALIDGVTYVDDSKATNPHAAAASMAAFDSVVWVAGGLAKGAGFDDLVTRSRAAAAWRGARRP